MSCYLCSPPACLVSSSGQWSTLTHEHHVKQFHLGPYKPYKCIVGNCNQSVTVKPFFPLHGNGKHSFTRPVRHGSEYLEGLTDVLMQYNFYSAGNSRDLARDMVKAIQTQLKQPENQNQIEAAQLTEYENSQSKETQKMRNEAKKIPVHKKKKYTRKMPKKSANFGSSSASVSETNYCKKCEVGLSRRAVKAHLSGPSHIGKYCLHCNGCEYKTPWEPGKITIHMKQMHGGVNVGYTDKRDEIRKQLAIEEQLYIGDSQM